MDLSYRRTPPSLLERALARLLKGQRTQARSSVRLDLALNPGIELTSPMRTRSR
jgi:hypothetical protein